MPFSSRMRPFDKTPREILLEITSCLVAIEDDVQCTLSLVCRDWRQLVLNSSRLWTWITFPRYSKRCKERLEITLQHNRHLPLNLRLQFPFPALSVASLALLGNRDIQSIWIDIPGSVKDIRMRDELFKRARAWLNPHGSVRLMAPDVYWTQDGGTRLYLESPVLQTMLEVTTASASDQEILSNATLVTSATVPQKFEEGVRRCWKCIKLLPHLKRLEIDLASFLSETVATSTVVRVEELHIRNITKDAVLGAHLLLGSHIRRLELSGGSASVLRFLNGLNDRCRPHTLALMISTAPHRKHSSTDIVPDRLLSHVESLEVSFLDAGASCNLYLALQLTSIIHQIPRESRCLLRLYHSPSNHIFMPLESVLCRIFVECEGSAFQGGVEFPQLELCFPKIEHAKIALRHAQDPIAEQLLSHSGGFTFTDSSEPWEGIDPLRWPTSITFIDLNQSMFRFDGPFSGPSAEKVYFDILRGMEFPSLTKIRCVISVATKLLGCLPALEDLTIVAERQSDPLAFQDLRDALQLAQLGRLQYLRVELFPPWTIFLPLVQEQSRRLGKDDLIVQLPGVPNQRYVEALAAALRGEYRTVDDENLRRFESPYVEQSGCKTCHAGGRSCRTPNAGDYRCPRYTKGSIRLYSRYSE